MLKVSGYYHNGKIKMEREIPTDKPLKVIVTFVEEEDREEGERDEPYFSLIDFNTICGQDAKGYPPKK
jgi:hypothetical protein